MTDWTAIVGSVTTLLGSLGGYWLVSRNNDKRDKRAAARESAARRDSSAERLEEGRHKFQSDTLLELQDELQRLVRNAAQVSLHDQQAIKAQGQTFPLSGDVSDEAMRLLMASVSRLRSRVSDDQLRTEVGEFTDLCTVSRMASAKYRQGKVPDDQRDEVIAELQARVVRIANTYGRLTELLGVHLRRELGRRFLVALDHHITTTNARMKAEGRQFDPVPDHSI